MNPAEKYEKDLKVKNGNQMITKNDIQTNEMKKRTSRLLFQPSSLSLNHPYLRLFESHSSYFL